MRLTTPRARRLHPLSYRIYKKISDMGTTKIYTHTHTHTHARACIHLRERIRPVFWSRVACALKRAHPILTFDSISISKIVFGAQTIGWAGSPARRKIGLRIHVCTCLPLITPIVVPFKARELRLGLVESISKRDAVDGRFHDSVATRFPAFLSRFTLSPSSFDDTTYRLRDTRPSELENYVSSIGRAASKSSHVDQRCCKVRLNRGFL